MPFDKLDKGKAFNPWFQSYNFNGNFASTQIPGDNPRSQFKPEWQNF